MSPLFAISSPATPVRHDAWILAPFFKAGGRITAGDVHFVEQGAPGSSSGDADDAALTPAGETEFSRDAAFGYRSSNLVEWIREKSAAEGRGQELPAATEHIVSVSLRDLRGGGPAVVRKRLKEARGGCVVVNAVDERDLQVGCWHAHSSVIVPRAFERDCYRRNSCNDGLP